MQERDGRAVHGHRRAAARDEAERAFHDRESVQRGAGGEEKIRQRLSDARGPGRGRALCGLLSAAVRPDAAVAGPERRGRVQRGLRRARAAAPAARAAADKKGRGIMELLTLINMKMRWY